MFDQEDFNGAFELRSDSVIPEKTRHVLFDFDGTLSLLRTGWPEVMLSMFMELIPRTRNDNALEELLYNDIIRLNGKQTIYQMFQFAERVSERGGTPADPLWYKHEYQRRLSEKISTRLKELESGAAVPEKYLVRGALRFLEELHKADAKLYLASGTDIDYVRKESALLGIDIFFEPHLYGALDDYTGFSKKLVIDKIISDNNIQGSELLSFGDGFVEITNTKEAGGFAVAVASDENNNGGGRFDEWKYERLKAAGADMVIPDFQDVPALIKLFFGKQVN